ncbi:MAG: DUF4147 domain-containing protein [Erysipelotrichaceae bacterium]|nr:DUF4147 domain-containing protein [Erysipelotrichaceae bacterium]
MNKDLYNNALSIINYSIKQSLPYEAVRNCLKDFNNPKGKTILISIGKAAYTMAKAAADTITFDKGLIITKHNHSKEPINNIEIIEAGHPIPDNNSLLAGKKAMELVKNLNKNDVVLFFISGGGSALFEDMNISLDLLKDINDQLIRSGADINEINTVRKRLSNIKGGRFAKLCEPAKVINIILSDIIGDPLDSIASGPTNPDTSTYMDAVNIIDKYHLNIDKSLLNKEDISSLNNIENHIILNNSHLIHSAAVKARELGYDVKEINTPLTCDIYDAVSVISSYIKEYDKDTAIIFGGEITIGVKGNGLGGRNQHLSLSLLPLLNKNMAFFAIGSDGTDGPTDAAGGYTDYSMSSDNINDYLNDYDSYHGLDKINGLIKTGPTGTNVCDLYVLLYKKHEQK